jgi:ketosteroid isomerase-like protein
MPEVVTLTLARSLYGAYVSGDREVVENMLDEEFEFFSPADPGIGRDRYFERCWPNSERIESFHFDRLLAVGSEVFVTYESTRTDGSRFRNTEVLTFAGGKLRRAEVYFGWDL